MEDLDFNKIECGERIKELRLNNNLSQEEFSLLIHITQSHLSKMEKGITSPSLDVLFQMRKNFHVSIDYILFGSTMLPDVVFQRLQNLHLLLDEIEKELTFMATIHGIMNSIHNTFPTFKV